MVGLVLAAPFTAFSFLCTVGSWDSLGDFFDHQAGPLKKQQVWWDGLLPIPRWVMDLGQLKPPKEHMMAWVTSQGPEGSVQN